MNSDNFDIMGMPEDGNLAENTPFDTDEGKALIKVIGVGGGGGNAANYMYKQHIPDINFVVLNTDEQHLKKSPIPNKLILGYNVTKGRGAGNNPETGRKCAEASAEDIKKLFNDGTEMVFITAGMGGGTGTGAAPVVARLAKEAGMLTIGIVTVPFLFEGERKILKAIEGADELKKHVDALLVINNENLVEIYEDLTLFNCFEKADDTLANAARSISEIISEELYINVDFEDVKSILKDSGTAIISTATGEGEHRLSDAINNALNSPLLNARDINTTRRLLLKFSCNSQEGKAINAKEIREITEFTSKLPKTIDVKWGIADDPSLGDKVKVTVLASGFDVTIRKTKEDSEEGAHDSEEGTITFGSGLNNPTPSKDEKKEDEKKQREKLVEVYGEDIMAKKAQAEARMKYAILLPSQFDDHDIIALIERTPTLTRDTRINMELSNADLSPAERPALNPQTKNPKPGTADTVISF